jgi:hypothetical protein
VDLTIPTLRLALAQIAAVCATCTTMPNGSLTAPNGGSSAHLEPRADYGTRPGCRRTCEVFTGLEVLELG